jgi:hypothetical protein
MITFAASASARASVLTTRSKWVGSSRSTP